MAKVLVTESYLTGIADAIRSKNGSSDTYTPAEMSGAISDLTVGGVTPSGTLTIDQNGTYDVSLYANADVNVSGGSSGTTATGTVTFTSTYNTTGNRLIVSLADIGFTPTKFYLMIADKTTISGIQYVILRASFETDDNGGYLRTITRYTNTSNGMGSTQNAASWTTSANYQLYNDGTNIYIRTTSSYIISANTTYNWIAFA